MNTFRSTVSVVLGFGLLAYASGCSRSGTTAVSWHDATGKSCSSTPYPGCNYTSTGLRITIYQDPYYFASGFEAGLGYCVGWTPSGCSSYYPIYTSPTGIMYSQFGFALNDAGEGSGRGRDMISEVAEREEAALTSSSRHFAERYSLATDQAEQIVRTVRDWEILARGRQLTERDFEEFSTRVYGVSLDRARLAYAESQATGSLAALEALNAEVARHWGADPESSRRILRDWFSAEVLAAQSPQ